MSFFIPVPFFCFFGLFVVLDRLIEFIPGEPMVLSISILCAIASIVGEVNKSATESCTDNVFLIAATNLPALRLSPPRAKKLVTTLTTLAAPNYIHIHYNKYIYIYTDIQAGYRGDMHILCNYTK